MKINRQTNPIGCISLQQALTRRATRRASTRTFRDEDLTNAVRVSRPQPPVQPPTPPVQRPTPPKPWPVRLAYPSSGCPELLRSTRRQAI